MFNRRKGFLQGVPSRKTIYNIWLKGLEPVSFEGDVATLSVSSDFIKSMVEDRYLDLIKHGFLDVMGFDVTVKIESRSLAAEEPKSAPKTGDDLYTFDNFIVGQDNRFAHAASLSVAANPAKAYNPLFIYGASGLGKTHLLRAIENDL